MDTAIDFVTKRKPEISIKKTVKKAKKGSYSENEHEQQSEDTEDNKKSAAGHRPVTSCTHCRQHKIKCNASEKFPDACSRCLRMNLKCEIDPQFRPKKGSQIQSLRNDVDELKTKIELLTKNDSIISKALKSSNLNFPIANDSSMARSNSTSPTMVAKTHLQKEPMLLSLDGKSNSIPLINDSASNKADLNPALEAAVRNVSDAPADFVEGQKLTTHVNTKSIAQENLPTNSEISEFILGDVTLDIEKAKVLHKRFIDNYLPYLPIMVSNNPIELYHQSQLLFWTVMLTACLSDPDPSLYNSFASLIKQLAIETCWIRTPRSTHIVQSLLILSIWPLPNQKVLDDCSYRFIGLAKSLSLQLGLHRGKFMAEFTRTQVALPDAEKWRSRTWLAVFFCEQFWSSNLGLPPSLQTDYILESARIDKSLPKNFRCLICLSIFQAKLVNIMGLNVSSPDGLMEPANRAGPLHIMERELERLAFKLEIDDLVVEIYYLYVKLMVCLFSFMPDTPSEDQAKFVTIAYHSATRIVTIMSKLLENRQLTEYPIYVRHSVTTAAFILFRLHLTPYLHPKYVDSSRQSIVTVHRLFRNMLAAWKDVENDISRTATVLEKLNFVIITHPELFTETEGILVRMRSHLTGSLFYDLVWNIHEARRRSAEESKQGKIKKVNTKDKPLPLPFYNQITKDDFTAITTTTPNGTTVTKLVPTDQAITNATESANKAGLSKPTEINGIPLAMLEATGSLKSKLEQQQQQHNHQKLLKQKQQNQQQQQLQRQPFISQQGMYPPHIHQLAQQRQQPLNSPKPLYSASSVKKRLSDADFSTLTKPLVNLPNSLMTTTLSSPSPSSSSIPTTKMPPILRGSGTLFSNSGEAPKLYPITLNRSASLGADGGNGSEMSPSLTPMLGVNSFFDSPGTPKQGGGGGAMAGVCSTTQSPDSDMLNEMFIDSIFQQNSSKLPNDDDDDLLGWFDMNMEAEF